MSLVTNKRQAALLAARNIGFGVLALALSAIITHFMAVRITKISDSVAQRQKLAVNLEQRGDALGHAKTDLAYAAVNSQKIEAAFVPEDNISDFLNYINGVAKQNAITQKLHFTEPVPYLGAGDFAVARVDYSIGLSGANLTKIVSYLQNLERAPFVQELDSLKINGDDASGWNSAGTNANFNAKLFVRQ